MKNIQVFLFGVGLASALETPYPCRPVQFEFGINCECTESYCDSLYVPQPKGGNQFVQITSSQDGDRFWYIVGNFTNFVDRLNSNSAKNILEIDQTVKHEQSEIIGHGGAFTGAVSHFLNKYTPKLRQQVYSGYFSLDHGIGYNLLRVPIGGTDFDLEPWTYDNVSDEDPSLKHFNKLDARDKTRNVFIREVQQYIGSDTLKIMSTAWTPPLWMKAKHELSGQADNRVIPAFYQSLAEYYVKWVNFMKDDGVPIWTLSPGNEPMFALKQEEKFPALNWDAGEQADFVVNYLLPTLNESGNSDVKVTIFDDSREYALEYLRNMTNSQPSIMDLIDFISVHSYHYNLSSPDVFDQFFEKYEKKFLISEMSFGFRKINTSPGSWELAEELIHVLMQSFQHNACGSIDWNMMLNAEGGPTYLNEHLDALIISNDNFTAFYKQPMYYVMAHFAKFITPYSMRIDSTLTGPNDSQILALAYWRRDDTITVILYNNDEVNSISLKLIDRLKGEINVALKPKSLNTLVYSTKS